jgi:hypothetical protein
VKQAPAGLHARDLPAKPLITHNENSRGSAVVSTGARFWSPQRPSNGRKLPGAAGRNRVLPRGTAGSFLPPSLVSHVTCRAGPRLRVRAPLASVVVALSSGLRVGWSGVGPGPKHPKQDQPHSQQGIREASLPETRARYSRPHCPASVIASLPFGSKSSCF